MEFLRLSNEKTGFAVICIITDPGFDYHIDSLRKEAVAMLFGIDPGQKPI